MANNITAPAYVAPTYVGLQYPLRTDGIYSFTLDANAINAGLTQLLLTEPGERLFELEFGTPLRDLLFEQLDSTIFDTAAQRISASISRWEPRIYLPYPIEVGPNPIGMELSREEETQNTIFVKFSWQFKSQLSELYDYSALVARSAQSQTT